MEGWGGFGQRMLGIELFACAPNEAAVTWDQRGGRLRCWKIELDLAISQLLSYVPDDFGNQQLVQSVDGWRLSAGQKVRVEVEAQLQICGKLWVCEDSLWRFAALG